MSSVKLSILLALGGLAHAHDWRQDSTPPLGSKLVHDLLESRAQPASLLPSALDITTYGKPTSALQAARPRLRFAAKTPSETRASSLVPSAFVSGRPPPPESIASPTSRGNSDDASSEKEGSGLLSRAWPVALEWFKTSPIVAKLHAQHVASDSVFHMMKATPLVGASDDMKLDFANGPAGKAVADFMRAEQRYLGEWKAERIVEAAGPGFDAEAMRAKLVQLVSSHPVVIFSFTDCPWCLQAKQVLGEMNLSPGSVHVVELEDLGREGKALRAALALATGRTSMPNVFVGGRSVGGFTDGDPSGDPTLCHTGSPGLETLASSGKLQDMLTAAHAGQIVDRVAHTEVSASRV
eukprot:gnl/TRDRNA2_/TRDRNA2_182190_c0_seq1.p1 gnl/TRDRNA2_/TRDRNA2_182190_c0~~gnl/TRDRNA2_/TRDRNA2_182190_c0_seq1.p1  ORF type:complete len:352 (+),score=33.49 gnl/TRDRNA2_/TRDRNA2_182190_c0_seq1:70-1125(+)